MRVDEEHLREVRERGFTVVPGFLEPDRLSAAQEALWEIFPRPEVYFADPDAHPRFARSQFAGLRLFPYGAWALDGLAVHPDLVDAAQRLCGTDDLELYKIELWGKYAGAVDYDQAHHRDYGNHSLVVPRRSDRHLQVTTFLLLSDVTEADGPTKLVPRAVGDAVPFVPRELPMGALFEHEVAATGPAGSLVVYRTDVLHRGSNFTAPGRSRFALLVDFQPRGWSWTGKMAWPAHALSRGWTEAMVRMTPRERRLFGFPAPGDPYWDAQTLADVGARYPGMDMTPYREAAP